MKNLEELTEVFASHALRRGYQGCTLIGFNSPSDDGYNCCVVNTDGGANYLVLSMIITKISSALASCGPFSTFMFSYIHFPLPNPSDLISSQSPNTSFVPLPSKIKQKIVQLPCYPKKARELGYCQVVQA
ncbi:hypothetical protein CSKR_109984 [Clonorchis sinensis]|uniref:Uncharacterized protein n=1 Tax=Clonorchis sinensis TaxID=79923 RepID=A0A3R7FI61_CLOSI|nr:hypothetical protein CSKR_109984 [Clonorchis sinensis]